VVAWSLIFFYIGSFFALPGNGSVFCRKEEEAEMIYKTEQEIQEALKECVQFDSRGWVIRDERRLREMVIDNLIYTAVFGSTEVKQRAREYIARLAELLGIFTTSIQNLYEAIGRGETGGFTVPAMNLRGMTYDMARAVFRAVKRHDVGAFIFEIARSEIGYTDQRPSEYAAAVMAAAIKENFRGPLFIQGDHFQVKASKFKKDPDTELQALKDLIKEAIEARFYNIDIDASTLVDLSQPTLKEQQRLNFEVTSELTAYLRGLQPNGVTISVGGEIGEVGGKNSTPEELRAFMEGYLEKLQGHGSDLKGISKISVQTGTTHGGVPLPDGTIARVKIDFETLRTLSEMARKEYGLSGAVQHGASTLPEEAFDKFPEVGTAEIHLATQFQNMVYEHPQFPDDLRQEIYEYLRQHHADERKPGETDQQFIYKTRKRGFGPFKEQFWNLPPDVKEAIGADWERKFELLFRKLRVTDTRGLVEKYTPIPVA